MFDADIDGIIDVIRDLQRSRIRNKSLREYVLSNAIVTASAKIESYFEGVVTDWISALNRTPRDTDQVPPPLRVRHLLSAGMLDACRRFMVFQDENQLYQSFGAFLGAVEMSFGPNGVRCPALGPGRVLEGRKYPSAKNIRVLFGRLGIPNVFARLNASANENLELLITSFNDVRGSVAHEGLPVEYNAKDVKKLVRDIGRFVGHVDRVFCAHVRFVSGRASWTVSP